MTRPVTNLADRRRPSPRQVDPNLEIAVVPMSGRVALQFVFPDGTRATGYFDPEVALDVAEMIEEAAKDARDFASRKGPGQ